MCPRVRENNIDTQRCATIQKYSISPPPPRRLSAAILLPQPQGVGIPSVSIECRVQGRGLGSKRWSLSLGVQLARCEHGSEPKPETLNISLNPKHQPKPYTSA